MYAWITMSLLVIRRINRIPNAEVLGLCGRKEEMGERINESVLLRFGNIHRMKNSIIQKRLNE